MAVRIRLLRMGRKKNPYYRIVVMDSRTRRDGRYLDKVGSYNPVEKPAEVKIDKEKVLDWLKKGAEPSKTVFNLLQKEGIALDWHLIRNNASEQVRNVELQKWELARKVREDKKETVKETIKVETPEPVIEEEVPVIEETAEVKTEEKPAETAESITEEAVTEEPAVEVEEAAIEEPIVEEVVEVAEPVAEIKQDAAEKVVETEQAPDAPADEEKKENE